MPYVGKNTKSGFVYKSFATFFTLFVWEMLEEGLETFMAYTITNVLAFILTKAFSAILIVGLTQGAKVLLKKLLAPIVKRIIYKKGNDKMEKLKSIFGIVKRNWRSILVSIAVSLLLIFNTGVVDIQRLPNINVVTQEAVEQVIQEEDLIATEIMYGEPTIAQEIVYEEDGVTIKYNIGDEIPTILYNVGDIITPSGTILVEGVEEQTNNIAPIIYESLLAVLGLLGIKFEKKKVYDGRIALEKAEKENAQILKEAKKNLKDQEIKATQNQAQQEKANAKAEAERIANEKKAIEKAEHDRKVAEAMARLQNK